jgi:hypothetical protein
MLIASQTKSSPEKRNGKFGRFRIYVVIRCVLYQTELTNRYLVDPHVLVHGVRGSQGSFNCQPRGKIRVVCREAIAREALRCCRACVVNRSTRTLWKDRNT